MALAAAVALMDGALPPTGADARSAPAPAPEALEVAAGAFLPDELCPVCGVEPCACGIDMAVEAEIIPLFDAPEPAAAETGFRAAGGANPLAWDGPAMAALVAFLDRRDALQAKHGERAVTDPSRPPASLARDLKERACALVDRLSSRAPDAEATLATLATLGALALALHERLSDAAGSPA